MMTQSPLGGFWSLLTLGLDGKSLQSHQIYLRLFLIFFNFGGRSAQGDLNSLRVHHVLPRPK